MNTTENNKIIAEFMGYIDNGCSEEGFLINPITNFDEEINDLKYLSILQSYFDINSKLIFNCCLDNLKVIGSIFNKHQAWPI